MLPSKRDAAPVARCVCQAWNKLGATLANARRADEARSAYEHALRLRPTYVRALVNLGIACQQEGEPAAAAAQFVRALAGVVLSGEVAAGRGVAAAAASSAAARNVAGSSDTRSLRATLSCGSSVRRSVAS